MFQLNPQEVRVIGALIEKSITTPDQYPLSLNALCNACNQKSNREPVVSYNESDVQAVLDSLAAKHLVRGREGIGSRVQKYQHRIANTEFSELKLDEQELAILCVLFLRGAQTPGELRTRTQRLASFENVQEVERVLQKMTEREDGPFVCRLAREPGRRESRYQHLFCDPEELMATEAVEIAPVADSAKLVERVATLENDVADLREEIAILRSLIVD